MKVGENYICISNNKKYVVSNIIPYKDENTKNKFPESNGWTKIVVYKPLYHCEIKEFSRSLTLFESSFKLISE